MNMEFTIKILENRYKAIIEVIEYMNYYNLPNDEIFDMFRSDWFDGIYEEFFNIENKYNLSLESVMGGVGDLQQEYLDILYKWVKEYWDICKIREYEMSEHIKRLRTDKDLEPLLYIFKDINMLMYELIHYLDLYGLEGEEINFTSEKLINKFGRENIDKILNRNSNNFLDSICNTLNTFGINSEEISLPSEEKSRREDIQEVLKETQRSPVHIIEAIIEHMRAKNVAKEKFLNLDHNKNASVQDILEVLDTLKNMDSESKMQLDEYVKHYYGLL